MVHPAGPANNAVPLPARLTLLYHLPVELHAMAEQLRQRLALLGCELTPCSTTLKTGKAASIWGRPT